MQADHRPIERAGRLDVRRSVAGDADHGDLAAQPFDQHRRDVAAAVAAHVDDQGLLGDLRIEVLDEFVQAGGVHVGDVQVADLAAGRVVDLLDVAFHPVVVIELRLRRRSA